MIHFCHCTCVQGSHVLLFTFRTLLPVCDKAGRHVQRGDGVRDFGAWAPALLLLPQSTPLSPKIKRQSREEKKTRPRMIHDHYQYYIS